MAIKHRGLIAEFVVLIGAGIYLATRKKKKKKLFSGMRMSDDCTELNDVDPTSAVRHAQRVGDKLGWTGVPQSREELEERVLAMVWEAFPRCLGEVPETYNGHEWNVAMDVGWNITKGLEAGAPPGVLIGAAVGSA